MQDGTEQNWPEARIVDRLPVIIYASELGENGRWRYVSPQVEEILGYSAEEFLGDPGLWARLVHPDDRPRALAVESREKLGDRDTRPV
jgi:PAS domain S-box-containing protein